MQDEIQPLLGEIEPNIEKLGNFMSYSNFMSFPVLVQSGLAWVESNKI